MVIPHFQTYRDTRRNSRHHFREIVLRSTRTHKKNHKGNRYVDDYLLTSKLFCGDYCRLMVGESGRSRSGKVYHYYKCVGTKKLKVYKKKAIRKDLINE